MTKHSIIHVEFPAANREAAVKFYRDVFGWESSDLPNIPYPMFTAGEVTGGLPALNDMYQPGDVIVHIDTEDIAADLKNIEAAGGTSVTGVIDLGPGGAVAFFTDPTGNRLALFQSPQGSDRIRPDST